MNYSTIRDLQRQINDLQKELRGKLYTDKENAKKMNDMSYSTVQRMLNNEAYSPYFSIIDNDGKLILTLNNDFKRATSSGKSFVVLNPKTYLYLIQ